jgi:protein-disulfide isomerase
MPGANQKGGMHVRRLADAMITCCCVLVLFASGFVMIGPGGTLWAKVDSLRARRELRKAVDRNWPALQASSKFNSSPTVLAVEFADYECPYCRQMAAAVDSAARQGAAIGFRHFPLASHVKAPGAALAAICAEQQHAFPAMHMRLMTTEAWRADEDWLREARSSGVPDLDAFSRCLSSRQAAARLAEDAALAKSLGLSGTPVVIARAGARLGAVSSREIIRLAK